MIFAHLLHFASSLPIDTSSLESSISALESDISALESRIKSLESPSVPWEIWLAVSTGAVIVGLLMEYWVIWRAHRDEMEAFGRGIIRPPDRPLFRAYLFELASVTLITLGVFGELAIGLKIASINSSFRDLDIQLRSKNAELRSKSDQLVGRLNKEAEDERSARVQIEKSIEWRYLSDGAKQALCRILPPQTIAVETFVVTNWDDPEPALFADEIAVTIGRCRPLPVEVGSGVDLHQPIKGGYGKWTFPLQFGVTLEFSSKDTHIASSLLDALKKNGVDARIPTAKERLFPKSPNRIIVVWPRRYPRASN